jgi:hypothetical protein
MSFSRVHILTSNLYQKKDQVEVFGRKDQLEKKERKDSDSQIIQPSIYYFL